MNEINDFLTANEVAERLRVTPQYVRKLIKENKLDAERVGNQWLINNDILDDFIKKTNFCIEPEDHIRKDDILPEIVALSFFSGAMGLDIGMHNAGIDALLACEFNKYCRMTIEKNNPNIALIGDINNYSADEILQYAKIPKDRQVDVIFGGPPCQAFSTAGARRALDDERGNVFLRYIEVVEQIKPRYVVIENVRGLLSAPYPYKGIKEPIKGGALLIILDRLKAAGYDMSFELYNSANFGSPQIRERVVMIGKLHGGNMPYLIPTNSDNPEFGLPKWKTLGDAFQERKFKEHNYIQFPEKRLKFYRMLKDGQYWKDLPEEYLEEAMGNKLNMGGACIQEFPKDWEICGPILEKYKQIGNAVPIKLGEAIGKAILDDMNNEKRERVEGFRFSRYRNTNDITWRQDMDIKIDKMISKNSNIQYSFFE